MRKPRMSAIGAGATVAAMILAGSVLVQDASRTVATEGPDVPRRLELGPDGTSSPSPGESATDAAASPSPVTVTVEAGDVWFSPSEVSIEAGQDTVLALTGVGVAAHNLIIDELGLQLHVGPGITSEVDVSAVPPGTYTFYCSIYGHARAGMVGTLTVVSPAATASPEPVA